MPPELTKDRYHARKLSAKDAKLDYQAVMSSVESIQKTRGGKWPTKELSFEDDVIDLGWHQREFENCSSFAYTVMNPEETKCLGCFYLYPMGFRTSIISKNVDCDVDVSWWVTQEMYDKDFYGELFRDIRVFLKKQWPFLKPYFSNTIIPEE